MPDISEMGGLISQEPPAHSELQCDSISPSFIPEDARVLSLPEVQPATPLHASPHCETDLVATKHNLIAGTSSTITPEKQRKAVSC